MENCKAKSSEKKGKVGSSPHNYRPISLLLNISKVFETIINDSINSFCTDNSIIPETQFAFRHKHSIIHAVTKFPIYDGQETRATASERCSSSRKLSARFGWMVNSIN